MSPVKSQKHSQDHSTVKSQESECFTDFFINVIERYNNNPVYHYQYDGKWNSLSFTELRNKVNTLVAYLTSRQIEPGAHVAIISESRIEWPLFLFAAWLRGAIVVPIDEKMNSTELASCINSVQPVMVAISPSAYKQHQTSLRGHDNILIMDMHNQHDSIKSLKCLKSASRVDYHYPSKHDTVLIASTSSTSGERKGVMLNWGNVEHQINALGSCFDVGPEHLFLSVLPLHHMLELTSGLLTVFSKGSQVCYLGSLLPDEILKSIQEKGITHMVGVPIISDMLRRRMEHHENNGADTKLTLNTLIIGGAKLNTDNVEYFARHNINLLQGYGLTEASPVVCLNMRPAEKPESVGQPLPSVQIRCKPLKTGDKTRAEAINKTGEILIKGPNIMASYFNDDKLTKATIQDGWLHTGDIGFQDNDGFIYITGRLKNIIVLPSGKNVSAEEVEACIQSNPLVKEVCVTGICLPHTQHKQHTEQVCALVVAADNVQTEGPDRVKQMVINQCSQLSAYKRPQHVLIYDQDLPKTATGKIKRQAAITITKKLIASLHKRDD